MAMLRTLMLASIAPALLSAQTEQKALDAVQINKLIHVVASKDRHQIARLIRYPFGRAYPIPPIRNAKECLKRFDELFDDALLSDIAKSDPKQDWEPVGWHGIMLGNGEVWLDEDYKIIAINHETEAGETLRAHLTARQKLRLPSALRDFEEPVLEWTTPHLLIRVDKKGDDFRLIVFSGHSYAKPVHVLFHGNQTFDGTGGSYSLDWQADGRAYRVYVDPDYGEYSSYEEYDGPVGPPGLEDRAPAVKEHGRERVR